MADPEGYVPQYDFSGFQATNPTQPLPGHELDVELQNIADAVGQTNAALADIRRSDGKLKNGIVTPESVAPGFIESIAGLAPTSAPASAAATRAETAAAAASASASASAAAATRAETAAAAAASASASASAIGARFYSSVAEFNAAAIDPSVDTVIIRTGTEVLMYSREPGANGPDDLPHPSGSQWAKASLTTADLLAAVTDVIVAGRFPTYVEGAFLPEIAWTDKASGTVNYTTGSRSGSYVRIGRMVYIDMSFDGVTVARGTESGSIIVRNLPYPAAANTYGTLQLRRSAGIDLRDTGSNPPASVAALIPAGKTYGVLTITPANAASFSVGVARCSAAANAVTLQMTGWYEVQD